MITIITYYYVTPSRQYIGRVYFDLVRIWQRWESSVRARLIFNFKLKFRRSATDADFSTKRRPVTAGARPVSGQNRRKPHWWQLGTSCKWICD